MKLKVGSATDIGKKRSQNQDSISAVPELGLFVVCDGMGGHRGGETASATAVETIPPAVQNAILQNAKLQDTKLQDTMQGNEGSNGKQSYGAILAQAIQEANLAVHERAKTDPKLRGMGTTTTALFFSPDQLIIGHVGDSRCYFLNSEAIWQITRDHSLVAEKVKAGLISREAAKTDRMKNVITRSVGFEPTVEVDIYQMKVKPGDCFLICSDGLSGLVEDDEILSIVQRELFQNGNIEKTTQELISAANANGGDDNISSILVQVA